MTQRNETHTNITADDPRILAAAQEYLAALEAGQRPARSTYLARVPELERELVEYLDALDLVHGALPRPAAPPPRETPALTDAEPLGDFSIVREIGRGGMGVVYEAVQLSLGRRVALKVLPFAATMDPRHLQRFHNEARAAASLHHGNIVPVYAVGSERGVHFYAMQLIDGQNLAALIDDLRRQASPPTSSSVHSRPESNRTGPFVLPPSEREGEGEGPAIDTRNRLSTLRSQQSPDFYRTAARLLAQAAEGLDYAHSMGIVHRDVKPANLLVDGRGNVWITDFGLAQFHADAGLTRTGDVVGTLRYMSPEQAGGSRALMDHRTDVYSLGATLYELLTQRPIFDGTDRAALLVQIVTQDPRLPRSLDKTIPTELETIVLKAVAKVPAERYSSAGELARDLHRYLNNEPILARRETPLQLGRKWLRRHPAVPFTAMILLIALALGSLVSAWLIESAFHREQARAEDAEKQHQLARRAVDELIQLADEELADKPHVAALRKRLLESALTYYQEFIEQSRDTGDDRALLEATRDRVEKIIADLAVLQGAGQLFVLQDRSVLNELKLAEVQKQKLQEMTAQAFRLIEDFPRLTHDQRRERFVEMARSNESALSTILHPDQRLRLQQIVLQSRGPAVFQDAEVANALKLTAEQKSKVRSIEMDMLMGPPELPRSAMPHGKPRRPPEEEFRGAMQRIEAMLTPDQLTRWRELIGPEFKGAMRLGGPPGFRPGP